MKKQTLILMLLLVVVGVVIYFFTRDMSGIPNSLNEVRENILEKESASSTPLTYKSEQISLRDGKSFALTLPADYKIAVAAEGLGRARFMDRSPDGRLFVTDMKNLNDNTLGEIYILSDFDSKTKKYATQSTYLSNLRNPHSIAFYEDAQGTEWLYIALTDKLVRYKFTRNETAPTSAPETLATFPDYGLNYKYGGWYLTRTVVINNDQVYVAVGSSCNSCEEKEDIRAAIMKMNPDGSNQKIIATGLRNAVGLVAVGDELYLSNMGSDHLGIDKPEETFYKLREGTNYGWPYCYEFEGKIYKDDSQVWQKQFDCSQVPLAEATFPAHAAPLGVEYIGGKFLVALHGSGVVSQGRGYSIVQTDSKGYVQDSISGFLQGTTRFGRPVGILKDTDTNFFFTDDFGGVLYYVYKYD